MTKHVIIGTLLILIAALLDFAQLGIGLALTGSIDFATGIIAWIPYVGQVAEAGSSAAGVILGATTDFALSVSFGSFLIMLFIYFDMFYPATLFGGAIFEWIPFMDIMPGWTFMAIRCVWKKAAEDSPMLNVVSAAAGGSALATAKAAVAASKSAPQRNQTGAAPTNDTTAQRKIALKGQIDGIRPANNNSSMAYAA